MLFPARSASVLVQLHVVLPSRFWAAGKSLRIQVEIFAKSVRQQIAMMYNQLKENAETYGMPAFIEQETTKRCDAAASAKIGPLG